MKQLHKLVQNLTGLDTENPLPPYTSDELRMEDFAEFFINKIETIRTKFQNTPANTTKDKMIPQLRRFATMSESQVTKIIMDMQSKSCELDPIPTSILKRMLPKCIGTITKIINISLNTGHMENCYCKTAA